MLGWDRHSTADGLGRRIASLKDELDHLQSSFRHRDGGWDRLASNAHDLASTAQKWVSDRAESLPRSLTALRRHVQPASSMPPALPVIAAAVVVGLGVGCVLYAISSRGKRHLAAATSGGDVRQPPRGDGE